MAEENKTPNYLPQNQQERWLKYGLNVGVAILVVIALGIAITWLAEKKSRRIDTTASREYSLKPQTLSIIESLKSPVRIVSLYSEPQKTGRTDEERLSEGQNERTDYKQVVADLLEEYHSKGKNVEVETIDPVTTPSKVDDLITYVTDKYGGEVKRYKDFLAKYPEQFEQLRKLTTEEAQKVQKLPLDEANTPELQQTVLLAVVSVESMPDRLKRGNEAIDRLLKNTKPPDYKRATETVQDNMETFSTMVGEVVDKFGQYKADPKVPAAIRQYMNESVPHYQALKKIADDVATQVKNLGELKLDDLRQNLKQVNTILVMGDTEMRSLTFEQVWPMDTNVRNYVQDAPVKRRFAGEQQISTAIFSLQQKGKRKVVIMRPGGAPLAEPAMLPFRRGGPLSAIADRLRDYNFDVVEKDMSGMWAMQAQMQQMPSAPEPTDEQIKDAIWIVVDLPNDQRQQGMPPPTPMAPKIAEHLKAGYPVLVLMSPQGEDLSPVLKDYGISVHPDAIAVHDVIASTDARSNDIAEEAQRRPFIFVMNHFGEHPLTKPLSSLDAIMLAVVPVQKSSVASTQPTTQPVTTTELLPLPQQPKTWGERNFESIEGPDGPKFDEKTDLAGPINAGIAAQKADSRLVVFGAWQAFSDGVLNVPDIEMAKRGLPVARFPANSELFINSVFWLAKMEPMISISPAAMEVSRISDIKPAALNAWRVGVLLIGLPGLVVLSGLYVYFTRRD
ncbi:MAG TPA: Gldg family protein [Tepidisphaeraceae bacterium]|nr:Gldg family protein [Tepidisphaeraceae bacterium]